MIPSQISPHTSDRPPDLEVTPEIDKFSTPPQTLISSAEPPPLKHLTPKQFRAIKRQQVAANMETNSDLSASLGEKRRKSRKSSSKSELARNKKKNRAQSPIKGIPVSEPAIGGTVKKVIGFFEAKGVKSVEDIAMEVMDEGKHKSPLDLEIPTVDSAVKSFISSIPPLLEQSKGKNAGHRQNLNSKKSEDVYDSSAQPSVLGKHSETINSEKNFVFGKSNSSNFIPAFHFDVNGCLKSQFVKPVSANDSGVGNDNTNETIKNIGKGNVWSSKVTGTTSFADVLKKSNEDEGCKVEFIPPTTMPNGKKRVEFSVEEIQRASAGFTLQLVGYFVGTSMDYNVVNANLRRMWRSFDFKEVTKTAAGFYLCKFNSEKGMQAALENGPWLINNVPFILNQWVPGVWLEKIEPSKVPIWVCIHNLPIELWNAVGVSKLMSCVGRPLLMDKITKERCLSSSGRYGYARVLVEVSAEEELPLSVEFAYPAIGNFPPRVGALEVSYSWKPPLCTFCKVFGHSTKNCKERPRSDDEIAAQTIKDALKVKDTLVPNVNAMADDDGFIEVNRKNKSSRQNGNGQYNRGNGFQHGYGNNREGYGNSRGFMNNSVHGSSGKARGNVYGDQGGKSLSHASQQQRVSVFDRIQQNTSSNGNLVHVPEKIAKSVSNEAVVKNVQSSHTNGSPQSLKQKYVVVNDNRDKQKVVHDSVIMEVDVPTSNSFHGLEEEDNKVDDDEWDEEEQIWESEKVVVDGFFKSKSYPTFIDRCKWSKNQIDYFFINCSQHGLDPDFEKDDVASEENGTASYMKEDEEGGMQQSVGTSGKSTF